MRNSDLIDIAKAYFAVIKAMHIVVTFVKVKAHSGDRGNEAVNRAALAQARKAYNILSSWV